MRQAKSSWLTAVFLSAMAWLAGCGDVADNNLSVKADADAGRLQTAQAEAQKAASKARTAEIAKTKGRIRVEDR